ncbi:MAG TPA: SusC/RagA family TonB-linked outer membrane protein [Bacteroidota bacterium]
MKRVTILLSCLLLAALVPGALFAQSGTVAGKVTSAAGDPLPGANVVVQVAGLMLGAAADANGSYTITTVPAGSQRITARFVGYRSEVKEVNVAVGAITEVDFTLSPTVLQLDEVVVTGAGAAVEKMKLGNTVGTINSSSIAEAPVTTLAEILSGRVPGVQSLPNGGLVGEGASIRIRGSASLSQENTPIIYIDGVRVGNTSGLAGISIGGGGEPSRLDDLNPEAIERVEILKGAAAATLYGTQANAGVIQIFTKQGSQTRPKFSFEVQQGAIEYPAGAYKANTGFARSDADAARLSTILGRTLKAYEVFEENFMDKIIGTGYTQNYSASVSGGQAGITYFANMRYSDTDGPFNPQPESFFGKSLGESQDIVRRGQFSANLNVTPSDRLNIRLSTQYTNSSQETFENNNNIYAPLTSAQFGKPERIQKAGVGTATSDNAFGNAAFQTAREGFNQETKDRADHGNVALTARYNLTPELTLEATAGLDYISQRSTNFSPFGWNVDNFVTANVNGELTLGTRQRQEWTVDTKAIWNTNIMSNLGSQLIVGIQGFRSILNTSGGTGVTFPGSGVEVLNAGQTQTSNSFFSDVVQAGVLAQEQLSYADYLFVTLGIRLDANSAFGSEFETAKYPKASLSVLPLKALGGSIPYMSTLRVRAAIGQSGQQPGAFDKLTTFAAARSADGSGLAPDQLGNQKLKPEVATEWELGFEAGFLDDRIGIELTYWDRTVKDALVPRAFAPSGGFYRTQLDNIGELVAHGFDIGVNLNVLQMDNVSVSMFVNGAYLQEEITSMGGAPPLKVGGSYPRYRNFIRQGYAPGSFFGPILSNNPYPIDINQDGIADAEQKTGTHTYANDLLNYFSVARDPSAWGASRLMVLGADMKPLKGGQTYLEHYLGKPMPDWQGSFGFNVTFLKNLRLASLFEYKFGNYFVHNLTDAFRRSHATIGRNFQRVSALESTMMNPASTPEQRVAAAATWAREIASLSPYDGLNEIEEIYLVRWRELSLTYDIPTEYVSWIGVGNASVTFAGRNLVLWTDYSGIDPETNVYSYGGAGTFDTNFGLGIEAFGIPIPRQYVFTLRFGL